MSEQNFELTIICSQAKSQEVVEAIKELGISFDLVERRAFAPSSPDVAIKIVVALT